MRSLVICCLSWLLAVAVSASSSVATLVGPDEPGVRMNVHGRVFDAAGRPLRGAKVSVHHADAAGLYQLPGQRGPRLRATVITDAQGRFELHTIRPASFPGASEHPHIHFEFAAEGHETQWQVLEFSPGTRANDATIKVRLKKP